MHLLPSFQQKLLTLTKSEKIAKSDLIQGVWGGYGQLLRIRFVGGTVNSLVLKVINTPKPSEHPKGWNTDKGHQRKLLSYQIESYWYQHITSQHHHNDCYLPHCLLIEKSETQQILVLEDLTDSGFPIVKNSCSLNEAKVCITWLAQFHAKHLGTAITATGLWSTGSYWHLATRPDELEKLTDIPLKEAATRLDQILCECPIQTIIHGDAKLANFCFSADSQQVAAVDFQYVGKGCGMKDIILFISSAVKPNDCAQQAPILLDHYFDELRLALIPTKYDSTQIEALWRPLYSIAWADFQRFVKGWSPDHWKINRYTEALTAQALREIDDFISPAT